MGYRIEVNHQALRQYSRELRDVAVDCRNSVRRAADTSSSLRPYWSGDDANVFYSRLSGITSAASAPMKTSTVIEQYADILESAANDYTKAQADAINRANRL